jgi:hypothetical protein
MRRRRPRPGDVCEQIRVIEIVLPLRLCDGTISITNRLKTCEIIPVFTSVPKELIDLFERLFRGGLHFILFTVFCAAAYLLIVAVFPENFRDSFF